MYQVLLSSMLQLTILLLESKVLLMTTYCLRLFVVVYGFEML